MGQLTGVNRDSSGTEDVESRHAGSKRNSVIKVPLLLTQRPSQSQSFVQTVGKLRNLQHAYIKLTAVNTGATDELQQVTARITAEVQQAIYLTVAEVHQVIYLLVAAWLCGCLFVPVLLTVRVALLCCVA